MNAFMPTLPTSLQTARDTVVTMVARDGLQTAADVALVVLGVFLVVLLVALFVLLLQLRKLNGTIRSLGDKALDKADPIMERGRGVADNVEFISAAVRSDVERLNRTVKALTDRLQQASDHMEERIDEFNALMEVVQDEAEDIFIGTAATARGVREGVRSLKGEREEGDDDRGEIHVEDDVFLTAPSGEAGVPGGSGDTPPSPPPERTAVTGPGTEASDVGESSG